MNMLQMKYALEVARCGSINKAAENLLVNQPNLSRSIKELESSLGVKLFVRNPKGMSPTPEGETFLVYANNILNQVYEVEAIFKSNMPGKKKFSASVPRAEYISEAFVKFSLAVNREKSAEIIYTETNARQTIRNVYEAGYRIGIIRYAENLDTYYRKLLTEKELSYEVAAEFNYVLIVSIKSPLAEKKSVSYEDVKNYIEIAHADPFVPSSATSERKKPEDETKSSRRIYVYERAGRLELISKNPQAFIWDSPVSHETAERYGLVQIPCSDSARSCKDVIIRKKTYRLTQLDRIFLEELRKSKKNVFG